MQETGRQHFVILHHTGYGAAHWDLMLEEESSLATWKLYRDPAQLGTAPAALFRIADHRKAYLEYEGPISGGRGQVHRVCSGTYSVVDKNSQSWTAELHSADLPGPYALESRADLGWRLRLIGGQDRAAT